MAVGGVEGSDLTTGGLAALTLACSSKDEGMLLLLKSSAAAHPSVQQHITDIWEMTVSWDGVDIPYALNLSYLASSRLIPSLSVIA